MRKAQNPTGLTEKKALVNGRTVRVTAIPESRVAEHRAESKLYTHFAYLTVNTGCHWCGYTGSGNNFRALQFKNTKSGGTLSTAATFSQ